MELVGRPTQLANFECLVGFIPRVYLQQGSRAGVYWLADDPERILWLVVEGRSPPATKRLDLLAAWHCSCMVCCCVIWTCDRHSFGMSQLI